MERYGPQVATRAEIVEWISTESESFARAITPESVEKQVPSCPAWTVRDLVWHLGRVQRFWASIARTGRDEAPAFPEPLPGPSDAGQLAAWMRFASHDLLDALGAVDWQQPAWTWWRDDRTVGAIARHQAQEVAVHRWDAQSASGDADRLPAALAIDGVDEFVWLIRQLREPMPVALTVVENGYVYSPSDDPPVVNVRAPASDLVLMLYGRIKPPELDIEGDESVLDAFLMPIG